MSETAEDRAKKRFEKYLNGPMGKETFETLDEGESFILRNSEHIMRVTRGAAELMSRCFENSIYSCQASSEDSIS